MGGSGGGGGCATTKRRPPHGVSPGPGWLRPGRGAAVSRVATRGPCGARRGRFLPSGPERGAGGPRLFPLGLAASGMGGAAGAVAVPRTLRSVISGRGGGGEGRGVPRPAPRRRRQRRRQRPLPAGRAGPGARGQLGGWELHPPLFIIIILFPVGASLTHKAVYPHCGKPQHSVGFCLLENWSQIFPYGNEFYLCV